ncbi:MAG: acetate--CoA ligase family protein, partial [Anaerolineae bacterium]|nr:acetate--CoA ligase family protein [Anaerolineae bacterium]
PHITGGSMHRIFYPQSIVVIGVSEKPDNLARNIILNLRTFHYAGALYAVGRERGEVYGVPIVPSLDEVPDGLDLAAILVPAPLVPGLMEACGRKGIRHVVIESGGFSEFSEEGRRLEEQLKEIARRWGIRFVGPNCISVVNLDAGVCLPFAPISRETLRFGPVSVVAQSGGVSITYAGMFSAAGLGVNKVVSIGNKADLDEADYLAYLLEDPGTRIVCLYLESVDEGRRLMDLARRSEKPIIVHKANRGSASQNIARSHTAALANDDRIVSAAFHQVGILRADTFGDAVAIAQGLTLPPVRGNDIVVISRSGGHAVVAADFVEKYGFRLAPLPESFVGAVRSFFRADVIAPTNPLDLGVIFDFGLYARIVEQTLQMLRPDAVLLVNTYSRTEAEGARHLAQQVDRIVRETGMPVALCMYGEGSISRELIGQVSIPVFLDIEQAMVALAASRDWHRRRARLAATESRPDGAPGRLSALADRNAPGGALALCQEYGIPVAPWAVADDPDGAAEAADALGYPVVLKALSARVVHKSDVGGVVLGLRDRETVRQEAAAMRARVLERVPEASDLCFLVQRMVEGGVEVILGGKQDPSFGPVVMFGLGGVFVEVFGDVSFRVAPLTRADAEEMLEEIRGKALLAGARGRPPADREALVEAILAFSRLVVENPSLAEVEINPLLALPQGVVAVDARWVRG